MKCRFCKRSLIHEFIDLGMSPLANSYISSDKINQMESFFPLRVFVCDKCLLVQLDEYETPEHIFSNYAYFSSYSQTWLDHVEDLVNKTITKFNLKENTHVIEIASNDGYLLQHYKRKNIPILGIEPAANVASVAQEKGIPTIVKFFGSKIAKELVDQNKKADILIAVNVLPHVPELNDFIDGMKILLKTNGVIIIQFSAYLPKLIQQNEFDTIYHEHYSYFSLLCLQEIFSQHGLKIFDVEELEIHGGSLRLYVKLAENDSLLVNQSVSKLIQKEKDLGLDDISTYKIFSKQIHNTKIKIWEFFISAKKEGKKIVCYGAPAKGNTLLNYCGIGHDFIDYTVDINPHKQGKYLPGTHIPILSPDKISDTKPDYLLILPWNLKDEIMNQMSYIRKFGSKFVTLIPEVRIYS